MDRVVVTRLLSSKKEEEASAAQHLLADAAVRASRAECDEAVAILLAALQKDEWRIQRRERAALWVSIVGSLCALGIIAIAVTSRRVGTFIPSIVCFVWSGNVISSLLRAKHCSPVRARVALALAEHEDLRAVGLLVEAFGAGLPAAPVPVMSGALKRLLPRVSPGDNDLLNNRQRAALNTLLREWDPQKVVARPEEVAEGIVALLCLAALVGDKNTELAIAAVRGRQAMADRDRQVVAAACARIQEIRVRLDAQAAARRMRARP